MKLNKLIIHKILKEPGQDIKEIKLSKELLPNNNQIVIEFANALSKAYFHKNSRFYTQFKTEKNEPIFKTNFDKYLSNEYDFLKFSIKTTYLLEEEMRKKPQSKGGILVAMHYTSTNNKEYLFIALLDNKKDFSINDTLELVKQITLNIEQMAMASVINISKYQNKQNNYLTFLKGLRDIPDYFLDFMGADSNRNKKITEITKEWVDAINDFFQSKKYTQDIIEEKTNALLTHIKSLHRKQEIITADIIANAIYPENPKEFISYIYDENSKYELPSEIEKLDPKIINTMKVVSYSNKHKSFSIKFKRVDLGKVITITEESIIITDTEIIEEIQRKINNGED